MKGDVMKAIRAYCLDCCCNQPGEVRECGSTNCALFPFRMGKDPFAKRTEKRQPTYNEHTFDFINKKASN